MSQLILYHSPYSPFSRSVLLLCHHLKLDVKVMELNLAEGEHLQSDFTRINPQRCVPTLDDNGFILWESRAILSYLAAIRGQHLVPQTTQEEAKLNQRLFSEMGGIALKYAEIYVTRKIQRNLFQAFFVSLYFNYFQRPLFNNSTELDQDKIKELYEMFSLINEKYFTDENKWIAGEKLTVADFAFASTVAGLIVSFRCLEFQT